MVVALLTGWQEWRQFAFDDLRQSLEWIREQTALSATDLPGTIHELATGLPAMRAVLTEHLIEHGAPAFLPVLALAPVQRVAVARAVLSSLAERDATRFDQSTWWVASEIVPLLDPVELYRDVPVGLVLHPRAMPLTPCALGPVFALLRTVMLPGSVGFETVTGLMGEWEGSFEELLLAATQL